MGVMGATCASVEDVGAPALCLQKRDEAFRNGRRNQFRTAILAATCSRRRERDSVLGRPGQWQVARRKAAGQGNHRG